MKTKLLSITCCMLLTCYAINSKAQANRQLSNLISPTAVNVDLLPGGTTGTKNLGSQTKKWGNGYFNGTVSCSGAGNSTGVYASGDTWGFYGTGGKYGIYAYGSTYGVRGAGVYGVYGTGSSSAIFGYATS